MEFETGAVIDWLSKNESKRSKKHLPNLGVKDNFGQHVHDMLSGDIWSAAMFLEDDQHVSRLELSAMVEKVAMGLRSLGYRRGDILGIVGQNSNESFVLAMAAMLIGMGVAYAGSELSLDDLVIQADSQRWTLIAFDDVFRADRETLWRANTSAKISMIWNSSECIETVLILNAKFMLDPMYEALTVDKQGLGKRRYDKAIRQAELHDLDFVKRKLKQTAFDIMNAYTFAEFVLFGELFM